MRKNIPAIFEILEKDHQPTMLEQLREYSEFQQLVATLLSARTKDSTTIPIVKRLFKKYKKPKDFLEIKAEELFGIGFYKVKAGKIRELSKIIINDYKGKVPDNLECLVGLPGVGRKTANCVLGYVFGKPAIGVDVHVHRIANRLGWVKTRNPEETEEELRKLLPKHLWGNVNMLLVDHGQRVCWPRNPECGHCRIGKYCASSKMF